MAGAIAARVERVVGAARARVQRVLPYLPWLSLAVGVGGAVIMNRAPTRAWIVVVAAVGGWALLFAANVVERRAQASGDDARTKRARFAVMFGSQSAVQTALFFPLPFYVKAASVTLGHGAFFAAYALVVVIALWDPLFARAMARPWSAFCVNAFAAFIGLNMVLPVLGLANRTSLFVAAGVTAVGVPVVVLATTRASSPRARIAVVVAGALALVAGAWFAAPLVPPAPLELTSVRIGSRVEHKELVDAHAPGEVHDPHADLVCHSAIKAPLGLKDALVHQWRRAPPRDDGADASGAAAGARGVTAGRSERLDRIALDVSGGGREQGYRTWSRKRAPASGWPAGTYTCRVETATGQVLGEARVVVGGVVRRDGHDVARDAGVAGARSERR